MAAQKRTGSGRNPVLVLEKVDAILSYLQDVDSAGPTEVSQSIGLNKSTTFRLLSALDHMGLVDREEGTGRYRLGMRLLLLGSIVEERLDLRTYAQPHLEQLARETGQTSFLCVRQDDSTLCLSRVSGLHVNVLELQPGGTLPLHLGAAGRVLLASMTDDEIEAYLQNVPLTKKTEHTLHTPEALKEDVERTRRQGYTISWEDVTPGICAIGAPIYVNGKVEGAISIAGLTSFFADDQLPRLKEKVLETAARISRRLLGAPR